MTDPEKHDTRLTPADGAAVIALAERAAAADGSLPLNEETRLAVAHGRAGATHLLSRGHDGSPVGYAYVGPPDAQGNRSGELCVDPSARRQGVGTSLARAALAELAETAGATDPTAAPLLDVWAHGALPAARALADRLGFTAVRELQQFALDLDAPAEGVDLALPAEATELPGGAVLRTFRPDADDDSWLALNAAAFAHHPEQGGWTRRELAERRAEPWFDPAGFFLAEQPGTGELLGFHWTKVHPRRPDGAGPVGEIYVLGVAPGGGGRGLGRALALAGLRHLHRVLGEAPQVRPDAGPNGGPAAPGTIRSEQPRERLAMLYVEGDNAPALRLYRSLGFQLSTTDVQYQRTARG